MAKVGPYEEPKQGAEETVNGADERNYVTVHGVQSAVAHIVPERSFYGKLSP